MPETSTGTILRTTREIVSYFGLHTGEQFADPATSRLDFVAAIYRAATDTTPNAFTTDENKSLLLIEANTHVMDAVRMVSSVLPTEPCTTEVAPGHDVPDYVEHVSNWASTVPVFGDRPPTVSEVIGVLTRAADKADQLAAASLPNAA